MLRLLLKYYVNRFKLKTNEKKNQLFAVCSSSIEPDILGWIFGGPRRRGMNIFHSVKGGVNFVHALLTNIVMNVVKKQFS